MQYLLSNLFYIDNLSLIMLGLIGCVATVVGSFSTRYLQGDRKQYTFYIHLIALVCIMFIMVTADNLILLLCAWAASNSVLTLLMLYKYTWQAAKYSAILAAKNFGIGVIFLGISFLTLYLTSGETSIQIILQTYIRPQWSILSSVLMIISVMMQSALLPFYRWLTSSLNAPTPVSAIMHAGLINVSGFLLARFSPLISKHPSMLGLIFIIGMISAFVGTLWKLMQSDVKRMLACSTIGQMGFMVAQCGLGLFPAAVAHLCWHGLFKSYLFLASGSAAREKRFDIKTSTISINDWIVSTIIGLCGAFMFTYASDKNISSLDTNLVLIIFSTITGTQFSLSIIGSHSIVKILISLIATSFMGIVYGFSVYIVEQALQPLNISAPQRLNFLHLVTVLIMVIAWVVILSARNSSTHKPYPNWILKTYVFMINTSQPHPKTVTAHRNHYKF